MRDRAWFPGFVTSVNRAAAANRLEATEAVVNVDMLSKGGGGNRNEGHMRSPASRVPINRIGAPRSSPKVPAWEP
eukprot:498510-Pyramimonas_sp.AAC.1